MTGTRSEHGRFQVGPELLERLLTHLYDQLGGCLGVGINSGEAGEAGELLAGVGLAITADPHQWATGEGPLLLATRTDEGVHVDDLAVDERWSDLPAAVGHGGPLGVVALPGSWSEGGLIVLTVYLDHAPALADLRTIEEYEPLIATSAAVVNFCAGEVMRTDQILDMVRHRRVIEQAKGIVMARLGCDASAAFASLVRISQQANVKLREFSIALVERVGSAPAEPQDVALLAGDEDGGLPEPHPDAVSAAERAWQALRAPDRAGVGK